MTGRIYRCGECGMPRVAARCPWCDLFNQWKETL